MSEDVRFTQSTYGPALLAVLPAACLVALVWMLARWKRQRGLSLVDVAWLSPFVVGLVCVSVWYALGIGSSDFLVLALLCVLMLGCSVAVLVRDELFASMDPTTRNRRALLAAAVAGTCTLEFTCNDTFYLIWPWFWVLEIVFALGLLTLLWLVCGRRGAGAAVGLVILFAIGIAQHYVLTFRGTSILPSDLLAAGTALSVSLGYTYGISSGMLGGYGAMGLGVVCCSMLQPPTARESLPRKDKVRQRLLDLARAMVVAVAMAVLVVVPDYGTVLGADMDYWWSKDWYGRQGFLPSFVYCIQDLSISMPPGYSAKAAESAQHELAERTLSDTAESKRREAASAQFSERQPNIVVIQNETFCDLSVFDGLKNGYEGPEFWNTGMPDALARGDFAVSVFGGGTCNTEFEFLTGNSLAFVGTAKYPFSMYDLSVCDSLPRQLGALGYHTVGMHPNLPSNWNRDRAYEDLGFDEAMYIDEFEGADTYHTHVSDAATYEMTLDILKSCEEPVFVFDVTMQNHSGYDTGSIPKDELLGYRIDGLSEDDTFQLNEFLACIAESDRALSDLVFKLRDFDEPTVIVMYGDHHPWFSAALNDLLFPNEDELTHAERIHQTTYVVWANYDVAGYDTSESAQAAVRDDDTSADLLPAMVLDAIGAPLSDFQLAQVAARKEVRALNADGFLGADGNWHALKDAGTCGDTLTLLELVEYLNFGSKV